MKKTKVGIDGYQGALVGGWMSSLSTTLRDVVRPRAQPEEDEADAAPPGSRGSRGAVFPAMDAGLTGGITLFGRNGAGGRR
jgi:hypothetical protein